DPVFKGVDDKGGVSVRIPRAYWKVIAAPDGAGLGAYAFVLEQNLSGVAMEKVTFGAQWRRFMIPIKDLEDRLKLVRFPDAFHDADRFATSAGRALADIAKA
ncbi:MAG: DNA/RNA non-specific endonuclease, partial [Proteobacteria bacterium]|nr:DNA/RNA non-specific endonuclease [Pseudomonadota bacterium]